VETILALLPDTGERYLSTALFTGDDYFMPPQKWSKKTGHTLPP
jgi:hypothetical protein